MQTQSTERRTEKDGDGFFLCLSRSFRSVLSVLRSRFELGTKNIEFLVLRERVQVELGKRFPSGCASMEFTLKGAVWVVHGWQSPPVSSGELLFFCPPPGEAGAPRVPAGAPYVPPGASLVPPGTLYVTPGASYVHLHLLFHLGHLMFHLGHQLLSHLGHLMFLEETDARWKKRFPGGI